MRIQIFLLSAALFAVISCSESSSAPSGCCGFPAIESHVGNAYAYVPNVFTPDGNGINDFLTLFGDSLVQIVSMEVFDANHHLVFRTLHIAPGDPSQGWDGTEKGHLLKGIFDVVFVVESYDGTVGTLTGKVCNYPCSHEGNEPVSASGCQFSSQYNGTRYDATLGSLEDGGCFE